MRKIVADINRQLSEKFIKYYTLTKLIEDDLFSHY